MFASPVVAIPEATPQSLVQESVTELPLVAVEVIPAAKVEAAAVQARQQPPVPAPAR